MDLLPLGGVAGVLAGLIVLLGSDSTALSAGTLDQTFIGNPDCAHDTFDSGAGTIGPFRQEFVPSMDVLNGVDVCINTFAPGDPAVDVTIRRGSVAAPGEILTAGWADAPQTRSWVHVEFDPLAVVSGEKLVVEVSGYFAWELTCFEIAGDCTAVDPDLYPAGESSYPGGDFLFRTYGGEGPAVEQNPPVQLAWGDLDCSNDLSATDALFPLTSMAGIEPPFVIGDDCPEFGASVEVYGRPRQWGDVDCLQEGAETDALAALLSGPFQSQADYQRDVACPLGSHVVNVYR